MRQCEDRPHCLSTELPLQAKRTEPLGKWEKLRNLIFSVHTHSGRGAESSSLVNGPAKQSPLSQPH